MKRSPHVAFTTQDLQLLVNASGAALPAYLKLGPSAQDILTECLDLAVFLMEKNAAYGDSALKPLRVFSTAAPDELIKVRMDDKLSRLIRGEAAGEDAVRDLFGYYILLRISQRRAAAELPRTQQPDQGQST